MTQSGPATRGALFYMQGGHRLDGRKDELSLRVFHLMLVCTLFWVGFQLFVIVPLYAVRKEVGASIYITMLVATLVALGWLRAGKERAAAGLFLSLMWGVGVGVSSFNGGVGANGIYLALALSLNAAWLLGRNAAIACAALTLAISFAEAMLEASGLLAPGVRSSPMTVWNGQILIVLLTINPILGVLEALRRQVAALSMSEQRFRKIVDAINNSVFICDTESLEIVELNIRAAKMMGKELAECRGVSVRSLADSSGEDSKREFLWRLELASGGCSQTFEFHLGGKTWFEITMQRGRVADRDRLVVLAHDIDDRKRAEAEKTQLEARLRQSQQLESVGRLAGGVAHDFNNMLTVILGYSSMMKNSALTPTQMKCVSEIEKAGNRSKDITQQLLGFSRQQIIAPKPVRLNELLADLMGPLGRLIGEDIDLSFEPGAALWTVVLDPSQVNQILLNLVVNARDAMPNGGKLTIETSNTEVSEDYSLTRPDAVPGSFVMLAVSDTGTGIAEDVLPKIFEPFFTTKGKNEGTGLGLAMIYGMVKQNGGFVNVYSEVGRGTTFRIYFPRLTSEPGEEEDVVPLVATTPGSGTVLVVEDDDLVRELVTSSLERIGYTPLVAASPEAAIEICSGVQGASIRMVLTDVVMPGMNGMELREKIREVNPGMRVLFMSGYTANVIVKHGILKPGVFFIQKPFTVGELSQRIEEVLRGA